VTDGAAEPRRRLADVTPGPAHTLATHLRGRDDHSAASFGVRHPHHGPRRREARPPGRLSDCPFTGAAIMAGARSRSPHGFRPPVPGLRSPADLPDDCAKNGGA
jgi:hypothetical protein